MMNFVHKNNSVSFQGYDARKLKAVAITNPGHQCAIANELQAASQRGNFDVFVLSDNNLRSLDEITQVAKKRERLQNKNGVSKQSKKTHFYGGFEPSDRTLIWAQDINSITPKGFVVSHPELTTLAENVAKKYNKHLFLDRRYLPGGNIYFIRGKNRAEELLVGENERKRLIDENGALDIARLKTIYGINKIIFLPQMDFHIDLAIRPLDNKRVLIADDKLTLKVIDEGRQKLLKRIDSETDKEKKSMYDKILENLEELELFFLRSVMAVKSEKFRKTKKILHEYGFEVIPVPGRIYQARNSEYLHHTLNYMNGVVSINNDGDLVYITNKSKIDDELGITPQIEEEVDFSFERAFRESIANYVKPENVFFIKGLEHEVADNLFKKEGGIHCMAMEIPQ